ncbi:MAG: hypothetical protein QM730_03330 [Anaerolineales bacterium]
MRRLLLSLLLLVLPTMACTWSVQTVQPTVGIPTQPQPENPTDVPSPASVQDLEGPDINYNGIRFTLDPAFGSSLYVFTDEITLEGKTAHSTRFSLTPEEFCKTWCVTVYPVAEFEQAFGTFVFPPAGYRGGAAIVFGAQVKALSFQNGSGNRGLETFGQTNYAVSNEELKYAFRGYTMDKRYGIYVQAPMHTSALPDVAPALDFNSQEVFDYNQKMTETLNALTPADFTPNLDVLDALVESISVEAK